MEKPRAFFATVFNAEQMDGLPPLVNKSQDWDPLKRAEEILEANGARIMSKAVDEAYSPTRDTIVLPQRYQFKERSSALNRYAEKVRLAILDASSLRRVLTALIARLTDDFF